MFENHDRVNFNNDYENLALLHLNNPRIFHKLDKIWGDIAMKFSVVGLSETWLNDASDSPHIILFYS